jgi:hypothetical protein
VRLGIVGEESRLVRRVLHAHTQPTQAPDGQGRLAALDTSNLQRWTDLDGEGAEALVAEEAEVGVELEKLRVRLGVVHRAVAQGLEELSGHQDGTTV